MQYKSADAFKGSEIWWSRMMMQWKMLFHAFILIFFLYLAVVATCIYIYEGERLAKIFNYIICPLNPVSDCEFLGYNLPLLFRAVSQLAANCWFILLASLLVWGLYPFVLQYFKITSEQLMADEHLRGSKFTTSKELNEELKKAGLQLQKLIKIGDICLPHDYETQHQLILGRAGSGKTSLILNQVDALRENGKVVIFDYKQDFVSLYYNPATDLILNIVDTRCPNFCPTAEIKSNPDAEAIPFSLIQPKGDQHEFWNAAARDVLFSILFYLVRKNKRTNKDLWEMVSKTEGELLQLFENAVSEGLEGCRKGLNAFQGLKSGSKTAVASDVNATMKRFTNSFFYLKDVAGPVWQLRDWITNGKPGFLFVANYPAFKETLTPILSLIIDLAAKYTLSLPDDFNRRIYFILDEFAQLQKLPSLVDLLAAGRSKGACVLIAAQDLNQLINLYGREQANSIINNCNTTVCFQIGDPATQDYMSRLFGDREILEAAESYSIGQDENIRNGANVRKDKKVERLILPAELGNLPKLEFYAKILNHDVVKDKVTRKDRQLQAPALLERESLKLEPETAEMQVIEQQGDKPEQPQQIEQKALKSKIDF